MSNWPGWTVGFPNQSANSRKSKLSICMRRELRYYFRSGYELAFPAILAAIDHGSDSGCCGFLSAGTGSESGYGPLPVFEFHSGFWVNLHQFLYHEARLRESTPESKAAAANTAGPALKQNPVSLTAAEQKTWEQAIASYRANYAGKDPQINIDLILLKNQLGDFEDCDELLAEKRKPATPDCRAISVSFWRKRPRRFTGPTGGQITIAQTGAGSRESAPLIREQGVGLSQAAGRHLPVHMAEGENSRGGLRLRQLGWRLTRQLDPLRVTISSTGTAQSSPGFPGSALPRSHLTASLPPWKTPSRANAASATSPFPATSGTPWFITPPAKSFARDARGPGRIHNRVT